MPFVPDSQFEKQEKMKEIQQKVTLKRERTLVNSMAEEPKKNESVPNEKIIKAIMKNVSKQRCEKPKALTLKDLKSAIQIDNFVEEQKEIEVTKILDNQEFREVKDGFVSVLALTHSHPIKRKIFANKLQDSKVVSEYLNNNIILRMFNKTNEHLKFGVVYAVKYIETNKTFEELVLIEQLKKQQQLEQAKNKPQEQVEITQQVPQEVNEEHHEEVEEEVEETEEREE